MTTHSQPTHLAKGPYLSPTPTPPPLPAATPLPDLILERQEAGWASRVVLMCDHATSGDRRTLGTEGRSPSKQGQGSARPGVGAGPDGPGAGARAGQKPPSGPATCTSTTCWPRMCTGVSSQGQL